MMIKCKSNAELTYKEESDIIPVPMAWRDYEYFYSPWMGNSASALQSYPIKGNQGQYSVF